MRDFLFSETAAILGLSNIPTDRELAIKAGKGLCENVLEPIQKVWGRIHVRSAFRSEEVNQAGYELKASCAKNSSNFASHIWDRKDIDTNTIGATACIIIPSYIDYYEKTGDWTSLAWWIHHHIPQYQSMWFFPKLCAFNISWQEKSNSEKYIKSYVKDVNTDHAKAILNNGNVSDFYKNMAPEERFARSLEVLGE
jgi:hypothetical protein